MEQILQLTRVFWENVTLFIVHLCTTKRTKITEDLEKQFFGYEHPRKLNEIDKEKCEGLLSEQ